ncbi:MAG TPA: hypothetical protein PLZ37_16715 [Nitrospira sp.]|nr:hypothetical protein [Nitrospira sp. NTP1]HQR16203.1 hypothetical protein [Nitrospira sp.]
MARKAVILLVSIATFLGALSSCSRAFIVKAEGKYDGAIYFRFFDIGAATRTKHNVTELIVQQRIGNNQWDPAWSLNGERSIDEVEYGKNYDGLNETTPARALLMKGEYRVHVKDRPRFDSPRYGYVQFTFNETGEHSHVELPGPKRDGKADGSFCADSGVYPQLLFAQRTYERL